MKLNNLHKGSLRECRVKLFVAAVVALFMATQAGAQYTVPYTQNFDNIQGAVGNGRHSNGANYTCGNCLSNFGFSVYTSGSTCNTSTSCGQIHVANNTTASYRKSGAKSLAFPALNDPTNGTSKYLLLPQFSSTYRVNTLMVKFWMGTSSNSKGVLSVGYVTSNDTSTFVPIVNIPASAETYCSAGGLQTTAGRYVEVSLNTATDDASRIAIRWFYAGTGNVNSADVAVCCIDDLEVYEIPACPPVMGLSASPQYTTASLSWSESGSATQWQVALGSGSPVTVNTTPGYTFTGLTPNTEYTATVAAVCGSTTSETRSVTFTTLNCDPVTNLTAEALYNSAVLNWTEAGGATEWQVTLGSGTPVTVTSPTHTFTGLAPNTDYTATVRASCGGGLLSAPVSVNFHTACPQPTALAATDVTNGRIVLEWSGNASQYEVQLASNNAFTADFQTQTVSTATATFPNLNIGERYYVRVRAKCGTDVSAWTPTLSALVSNIPATGLYPAQRLVVLNDLEDHRWAYYSDTNSPAPLHSYNPADVKIVYFGNGTTNVSTSSDAWPDLTTFTAPSTSTISEGAAVGISQFDRKFDKFHYYQTLERLDGKTAATPEAATGRCAYRTIFNPFSMRPVYGTELPATSPRSGLRGWDGWRGFFAWRLKHVAGGAVYRAATGGTALAVGDTVGADVQLYFQPTASDGMEVEFEALWARAWLTIAYTNFGMGTGSDASRGVYKQNVGVERNFCVLQDYGTYIFQRRSSGEGRRIADVDGNFPTVPVTYTSVLPNGTSDGTTKAYEALSTTVLNIRDNYCYYTDDLPVRCHADTRFEYLTLGVGNSGGIHGVLTVHRSSFSADGYNFTMGRGMKHVSKEGSGNFDNDHGINYLWGIGRITSPDKVDQAGTHQFYTDHFEEIFTANSYVQNLSANASDPDALPGYSAADSNSINTKAATYRATGRSLNYTMRLETGSIGYPLAYYGWNNFVNYSSYGNGSGKRGLYTAPHVWVTGTDNRVRLILGNDYDRAREDSKQWAPEMAKDSCSLRTSVPFRAGNYWIQMPNQDQSKVMFTAVIKSGFHGYRMWRRAFDSSTGNFYAGDHVTSGFNYDTSGYSGSEGKYGTGQIDYLSSSNGSLPYGFGDGGTDGDPKNIYIGVSNNPTMFKGKRHCLIEGGYLWTSISGCAWDTAMTNRNDNDVAVIRMKGGQLYGSIFGGTNTYADGAGGRQIICTGGKVWGWISGGANGTSIADRDSLAGHHWGNTYIYAGGTFELGNDTADRRVGTYINTVGRTGANDGNLFGAGCGIKPYSKYASASFNENAWKFHECGEVMNSTVVVADEAHVRYDVYGGGNYGYNKVGCGSDVRILGGRVGGKVFGGSNNKSTGSSYIRMTGGTVEQGVYGGCNNWGILLGDVRMDIRGGTIGTDTWNTAGVYGGGFGQNTATSGNITVNIGDSTTWTGPTVYGDIYGGSQMGMVLGGDTVMSGYEIYTFRTSNPNGGGEQTITTPFAVVNIDTADSYSASHKGKVNYYGGDVRGNIYGGGYGQNAKSATSYGDIHVRILGSGANDVYGANNESGKPMGKVLVTIGSNDSLATDRNLPQVNGNVYGGGNMAACGTHATTTTLTVEMLSGTVQKNVFGGGRGTTAVVNLPSGHAGLSNGRATEVFIKNGSVQGNVYGGGNAAKVVGNTHVKIGK